MLLYGPDSGLVRERGGRLVATVVDDPTDPFRPTEFAAAPFRAQLRTWSETTLARALESLTQAEVDCKTTGTPAEAVCGQALMALSARARRQQR